MIETRRFLREGKAESISAYGVIISHCLALDRLRYSLYSIKTCWSLLGRLFSSLEEVGKGLNDGSEDEDLFPPAFVIR